VICCATRVSEFLCALVANVRLAWSGDWAWGLPLIVFTVLIHVAGFGLLSRKTLNASSHTIRRRPIVIFIVVIGLTTLLATSLHALEAGIWAVAYRFLGALPDNRSAMLYSLNAMTSYGHTNLQLEDHWHLLGAMEALNGWLLFGLSTAFLFTVIERVSTHVRRRRHDGV
jgi:MFS superfamily sulfate permease-like transporter